MKEIKIILICFLFSAFCLLSSALADEGKKKKEPIEVNGDKMEYSADQEEITASGNVIVTYKDSKLYCDRITVNVKTKDCVAEGNVRLIDQRGTVEAETMMYNFDSKTGDLLEAKINAGPFYATSSTIKRVGEREFVAEAGRITTCSFDQPHYHLFGKHVEFSPDNEIKAKDIRMYVAKLPVFYFPSYTHKRTDKFANIEIEPGYTKDWGGYILTALRFNPIDDLTTKLFFDFRKRLGTSQGFGLYYPDKGLGRGDFKWYYTFEHPKLLKGTEHSSFSRYLLRWRHKWDIDEDTSVISQFYHVGDQRRKYDDSANFLKNYFYREFERNEQPKSYALLNHIFPNSSFNFLIQKRTTGFFSHIEKLPEVSYDLPAYQLLDTPFYIKNETSFSNLANRIRSSPDFNAEVTRWDLFNKIFIPRKLSFLRFSPYIGFRETFYSTDKNSHNQQFRSAFYSGIDLSSRFFKVYNVNTDFLGLDINRLRHIINPSIKYAYIHDPTVARSNLYQFDSIDEIERTSKFTFELDNKLQTKRDDQTVDFALFRIITDYNVKRQTIANQGFSDILYDLELIPYSWMRIYSDLRYGVKEGYFKEANADFVMEFAKERSLALGPRYQRNGGKELAAQLVWRVNPKWKFRIYERFEFAKSQGSGFEEQEYSVIRDLHCWELAFTYNIRKNGGSSVFFMLTLKAFPKFDFDFNQIYYPPRTASETDSETD